MLMDVKGFTRIVMDVDAFLVTLALSRTQDEQDESWPEQSPDPNSFGIHFLDLTGFDRSSTVPRAFGVNNVYFLAKLSPSVFLQIGTIPT